MNRYGQGIKVTSRPDPLFLFFFSFSFRILSYSGSRLHALDVSPPDLLPRTLLALVLVLYDLCRVPLVLAYPKRGFQ